MKYKRLYAYLIDLTWTQYILQYQIHSSVLLTSLLMDWFQSISLEITFIFPMLVFRHTCSSLGANTFNNTINLLVIFSSFSLIIIIFLGIWKTVIFVNDLYNKNILFKNCQLFYMNYLKLQTNSDVKHYLHK